MKKRIPLSQNLVKHLKKAVKNLDFKITKINNLDNHFIILVPKSFLSWGGIIDLKWKHNMKSTTIEVIYSKKYALEMDLGKANKIESLMINEIKTIVENETIR